MCHKEAGIGVDVQERVRALLTFGHEPRVRFLRWGNQHGTNAYTHVPNVILAGTLFYLESHYDALARLASGKRSSERVAKEEFEEIRIGEHRHLILQALCRGAVRRCVGDMCGSCDAYIIAAQRSGIPAALPEIFPGCRVVPWRPLKRTLKGKVGEATKFIEAWFEENPEGVLPFKTIQAAVEMNDAKNFRSRVHKNEDLIATLTEQGIIATRQGYVQRVVQ